MTIEQLKQLVENLTNDPAGVSADDLAAAQEFIRAQVDEAKANAAAGELVTEEHVSLLQELATAKAAVDGEINARAEAAAAQAAKAAELLAELETEPAAAETEGEEPAGDEPPAVAAENEETVDEQPQEPELIAASAIGEAIAKGVEKAFANLQAQTQGAKPQESPKGRTGRPTTTAVPARGGEAVTARVFAGANSDGRLISSTAEAARYLHDQFKGAYQAKNFRGRMSVLHIENSYPESRLLTQDADSNFSKVEAVTSPRALTAAGGLCAPLETLYDVEVIGSAARPVRDALGRFAVERGGITYRPNTSAASAVYGAGVWTVDDDAADPLGEKGCYVVDCPGLTEAEIEAIYLCLEFSNITSRFDPETTASNIHQGLIAHARLAENRLLAKIAAGSKVLSAPHIVGATRDILANLDKATAYYRNRHRIDESLSLTLILPAWVKNLVRADLARQMAAGDWAEALGVADSMLEGWLSRRGVTPVWHLDGSSGLDEVQTVTITGSPTGGTFTLTYSGQTTAAIAYNASAATVKNALVALSNLKAEDITVTGNAGGPYTVTFNGGLVDGVNVPQMTAASSLTGGSSPDVTVATTTGGGGAITVNGVSIAAQTYPDAAAGSAIPGFPAQIDSLLFPSGSWLFLDGGSLDLGLVRDSELNSRNQYRQFSETFEGAAFRGVESLRLAMTVKPTGQTSSTRDLESVTLD